MYGLFENSYDHYEWHDLVAVSAVKENLVRKAADGNLPLLEGAAQEAAKDREERHYVIEEVQEI